MAKFKITKDMSVAEVLKSHPEVAEAFFKHGLHCLGCIASQFESIEEAAKVHGIDVDELVNDLNAELEE